MDASGFADGEADWMDIGYASTRRRPLALQEVLGVVALMLTDMLRKVVERRRMTAQTCIRPRKRTARGRSKDTELSKAVMVTHVIVVSIGVMLT